MDRVSHDSNRDKHDDRSRVGKTGDAGTFSGGGAEKSVAPGKKDARELGAGDKRGEIPKETGLGDRKRSFEQVVPGGEDDKGPDSKRVKFDDGEAVVPSRANDPMDVEPVFYGERANLGDMPYEVLVNIRGNLEDADAGALSNTSSRLNEVGKPEMKERKEQHKQYRRNVDALMRYARGLSNAWTGGNPFLEFLSSRDPSFLRRVFMSNPKNPGFREELFELMGLPITITNGCQSRFFQKMLKVDFGASTDERLSRVLEGMLEKPLCSDKNNKARCYAILLKIDLSCKTGFEIKEAIQSLAQGTPLERLAVSMLLQDGYFIEACGDAILEVIEALAGDSENQVRMYASAVIKTISSRRGASDDWNARLMALINTLAYDSDSLVRGNAATAIGNIFFYGSTNSAQNDQLLEHINRLAQDESRGVQTSVTYSIANSICAPKTTEIQGVRLMELLKNMANVPDMERHIARSVAFILKSGKMTEAENIEFIALLIASLEVVLNSSSFFHPPEIIEAIGSILVSGRMTEAENARLIASLEVVANGSNHTALIYVVKTIGSILASGTMTDAENARLIASLEVVASGRDSSIHREAAKAIGSILASKKMTEADNAKLWELLESLADKTIVGEGIGIVVRSGVVSESQHERLVEIINNFFDRVKDKEALTETELSELWAIVRLGKIEEAQKLEFLSLVKRTVESSLYSAASSCVHAILTEILSHGPVPEEYREDFLGIIKAFTFSSNSVHYTQYAPLIETILNNHLMPGLESSLLTLLKDLYLLGVDDLNDRGYTSYEKFLLKATVFDLFRNLAGDTYFKENIGERSDYVLLPREINACIAHILGNEPINELRLGGMGFDGDILSTLKNARYLIAECGSEKQREALIDQYLEIAESIVNDREDNYSEEAQDLAYQLIVDLPGMS